MWSDPPKMSPKKQIRYLPDVVESKLGTISKCEKKNIIPYFLYAKKSFLCDFESPSLWNFFVKNGQKSNFWRKNQFFGHLGNFWCKSLILWLKKPPLSITGSKISSQFSLRQKGARSGGKYRLFRVGPNMTIFAIYARKKPLYAYIARNEEYLHLSTKRIWSPSGSKFILLINASGDYQRV